MLREEQLQLRVATHAIEGLFLVNMHSYDDLYNRSHHFGSGDPVAISRSLATVSAEIALCFKALCLRIFLNGRCPAS